MNWFKREVNMEPIIDAAQKAARDEARSVMLGFGRIETRIRYIFKYSVGFPRWEYPSDHYNTACEAEKAETRFLTTERKKGNSFTSHGVHQIIEERIVFGWSVKK